MSEPVFQQLDQVMVLRVDGVKWLSAPSGNAASPQGIWSVAGILGQDLVLARDRTLIRIPYSDVRLVARYNPKHILTKLGEIGYGKKQ